MMEGLKKPAKLISLLQALAFQTGNEVSYNELGRTTGLDNQTVERYIDLLEKTYVIFRLGALSRNLRKELKRGRKIYFYDNGVRNAIIAQFGPIELRPDRGALWENFCIIELMKNSINHGEKKNYYFWRNVKGDEIDFIEESEGILSTYEFKWKSKKSKKPIEFFEAYKNSEYNLITQNDILKYFLN